ncbi:MAG TPA: hypothetical protein VL463_36350 [Kofleriaceae bacterium]|nr:hypothetical protein [Kofleriaceae bacterium]
MLAPRRVVGALLFSVVIAGVAAAAPPAPTGAHPRIFMDANTKAALQAAAMKPGPTQRAVMKCDNVIGHPTQWTSGGYMGLGFVEPLSACLIAYEVRGDAASAAAAVTYFKALLDDYQTLGDGKGGDDVVTHDTGYAMRAFGPYAAIAYDWLHDAPGVDENLRAHARERFAAWTGWYDTMGYHNKEPGANYHAGYVFAESMIAIAEGGEAGSAGDQVWKHVTDDIFAHDLAGAMMPGGVLDGGDWLEGWQYAPLSIAEYALSARALRDVGAPITGFSAWEASIAARTAYAMVPDKSGAYIGGDSETETPHAPISANTVYAVLVDSAPDNAKAWAAQWIADQGLKDDGFPLIGALAEARMPAPKPFPGDASTWYYARGSRILYARSDWSANAVWMVSQCASRRVSDHMWNEAGNFVLSRGSDHLIVDPTPYGGFSTLSGNGPTVASNNFPSEYKPGQGWWGTDATVDFRWARQTKSGVVAARCDYDGQFRFQDTASDIPRAMRDLVLVPYTGGAAMVVVDDVDGAASDRPLMTRLRSMGAFAGGGPTWRASVGNSDAVVQVAFATAGTPATDTPPMGDCSTSTRGGCTDARFNVGEWKLEVPATHAQSFTIVDAVAKGTDPGGAATSNGSGWRAVEMDRASSHFAVVAVDPNLTTVTYTAAPGTHVVVGAPAGSSGRSDVSATQNGGGCDVTVTPHSGDGGYDASPLVLKLDGGCAVSEDPSQDGFTPPNGMDPPPGSSTGDLSGGCCQSNRASDSIAPLLFVVVVLSSRRSRRARRA